MDNIDYKSILKSINKIIEQISKNPIEYRVECVEVSIKTNLGLYQQEEDGDGSRIYKVLQNFFCGCSDWDEILVKQRSFEKIIKVLDPPPNKKNNKSINAFLHLISARKFVIKGELEEYGVRDITQEIIESFRLFGIEYKEKADITTIRI